jgi:hypothetical protein
MAGEFFTCSGCGETYASVDEGRRCELQGVEPAFYARGARYKLIHWESGDLFDAQITGVHLAKRTHKWMYSLTAIWPGNRVSTARIFTQAALLAWENYRGPTA